MIQPPPIIVEPIATQPPPPARKFSPILILAAVILLVIVGAGGLILGKSLNNFQPSAQPKVVPSPTQISTPTPDETVDWKTYTSKNFTFKYPNDWRTSIEEQNLVVVIKDPAITTVVGACPGYSFGVGPYDPNENYSIYSSIRKTMLFGKTIEFSDKTNNYGCRRIVYFFDKLPTETTKPEWIIGFTSKHNNSKEVLDQILSTFKFFQ